MSFKNNIKYFEAALGMGFGFVLSTVSSISSWQFWVLVIFLIAASMLGFYKGARDV